MEWSLYLSGEWGLEKVCKGGQACYSSFLNPLSEYYSPGITGSRGNSDLSDDLGRFTREEHPSDINDI